MPVVGEGLPGFLRSPRIPASRRFVPLDHLFEMCSSFPATARYTLACICVATYSRAVWEVEFTDQFEEWWDTLDGDEQKQIAAAVRLLTERGPALARPVVDTITTSRHQNMKELRVQTTRTLFAFDPRRHAILLLGGDKRDQWEEFYERAIPTADDLYDDHLAELREEGSL
jgi:hypothetical protein